MEYTIEYVKNGVKKTMTIEAENVMAAYRVAYKEVNILRILDENGKQNDDWK